MPPDKTHTLSPMVYNHVYYIRVFAHFQQETEYFFLESNSKVPPCPCCGGDLFYRDCRKRIMRRPGGQKDWLYIRRFRCEKCGSYHVELPDCLLPYKHYEAEAVARVLDDRVSSDDLEFEDFPSFTTMLCWLKWFQRNLENINGYLRQAACRVMAVRGKTVQFSLDQIRESVPNWLGTVVRIIYNSGGKLAAFSS